MQNILIAADIPPLIATILRPWINRAETATYGMGEIVTADAKSATNSLRRRLVLTPAMEIAIETASVALARSLSQADAIDTPPRSPALTALIELIKTLRGARPSESTVSLGLGW